MNKALLDTDILSEILKAKNAGIVAKTLSTKRVSDNSQSR